MLADPVEGMLAGISSGPWRVLITVAAVLSGFGVCILPQSDRGEMFIGVAAVAFVTIFVWGKFGLWFFIGLLALVGMFAFSHAFIVDRTPKFSLFAVFTCAVIYLGPIPWDTSSSFGETVWSIALYLAAAFSYWILPRIIANRVC